jgi:hypothetical protein
VAIRTVCVPAANGLLIAAVEQEAEYIYRPFCVAFRSTKNAFTEDTY